MRQKKIILFLSSSVQLFGDLFQYILCTTTRRAETKHIVFIMCLDSVSLELETLVSLTKEKTQKSCLGKVIQGCPDLEKGITA